MATYFQGNPEIQAPDGLQTLVLMNPGYVQFSDSLPPPPTNIVFFNSGAGNSLTSQNLHHAPPSQSPQFPGIPLPVYLSPTAKEPNSHPTHPHHLSASHGLIPQAKFNHWNPINSPGARESQRTTQGLSLSLSSQQPGYGSQRTGRETSSQAQHAVPGEGIRISGASSSVSGNTNDVSGGHGVLLCSKYLKAAQDLLEEVVNLGTDETKNESPRKPNGTKLTEEPSMTANNNGSDGAEEVRKDSPELSTAERQDIQRKKAKLISMLDEVEQRYRQYHHQMQIVISSFEQATGMGSARSYTSLALKTISKQFRCLKDTITGQIRAANKSLGEEDNAGGKIGSSGLKFVNHQLGQQRALQRLGMIQQNAWRPQRGLPECSVSVLRAWLFEHFLHPYPKDSDKQMLAKQTGLTRNQVSNWFINARVRLWKPMVEEMYTEETQEQELIGCAETINKIKENSLSNSISPTGKAPPMQNLPPSSHSTDELSTLTASKSSTGGNVRNSSALRLPRQSELGSSPKKQKNSELIMNSSSNFINGKQAQSNPKNSAVKVANGKPSRDEHSFPTNQTDFAGGFVEYTIGQIGRYNNEQYTTSFSGNGVSLTLGLPHHTFLPNHQPILLRGRIDISEQNEFAGINSPTPHPATSLDNIDIQNRKRFVAQLLPDFVA